MDVSEVAREVRELRERLDDFPPLPQISEGPFPRVKILKDPEKKNYKLKPGKFPIYRGDKVTYGAWRRALLAVLKNDWNTFHYEDSYVFVMIYNSLEGKAQREASPFFESGGRDGRQDPEDFIAYLDRSNWDANKIDRARGELSEMKMGPKQRWYSFFPQWANKLTEAQGDGWPEDVKISMLKSKLNYNLKLALANNHLLPPNNYYEWLRIVGQIAQQHDELKDSSNRHFSESKGIMGNQRTTDGFPGKESNNNVSREWSVSGKERGLVGEIDSSGDTFMGGVNSTNVLRGPNGKPLRAKWKSSDQINKLREEGRCYRCERKGCSTRTCRILPAINPNPKKKSINIANIEPLNLELFNEDEDDDGVNGDGRNQTGSEN